MKILTIILFYLLPLLSNNIINIDSNETKITKFKMAYFIDKNNNYDFNTVRAQDFSSFVPNRVTFGSEKKNIWYKIELKNSTKTPKRLFVHFKKAYANSEVRIYELDNSKFIKKSYYNIDKDENISKVFVGNILRYEFTFKKDSLKTIYINIINRDILMSDISIYDDYNSILDFATNNIFSTILISILLILAMQHTILYFVSNYIEYIYYSTALYFAAIFQSRELGILANYGIHGIEPLIIGAISLLMFIIFMLYFSMSVFDLKKYKKFNMFFKTVIIICIVNMVFLITPMYREAIVFNKNLAALAILAQISLAIFVSIKKHPLAKHYLYANIFFMLFSIIALLFYEGQVEYNEFTSKSLIIGSIIEAIIFSFMLSHIISMRIKILKDENYKQNLKIINKSKKEQLGGMISVIAHQLKQPLNMMALTISNYELNKKPLNEKVEVVSKLISSMSSQINFANTTIDEFRHFFNPNRTRELVNVSYLVKMASELMKSTLKNNEVKFETDINTITKVNTFGSEIVQVLINLIKNANEQFEVNQKEKYIKVITYEDDNYSHIEVKDNAGGVADNIIEKIFEEYFSTKSDNSGTGLGLDICKTIIEDRCLGTLSVKNEDNGALFSIKLPKNL